MAQDPQSATASMIRNLEEKTGKTMDQWADIVNRSGLEKHKQRLDFLKSEHGLTHGYANLVVHYAKGHPSFTGQGAAPADDSLIESWFRGKEAVRPIYDALMERVTALGEVELAPKKAYMSLRAKTQFAIVQASTKSRLDLGLKLPGRAVTDRLEKSGSFNSMVSHRVRLTDPSDVDGEVKGWLVDAFRNAQ